MVSKRSLAVNTSEMADDNLCSWVNHEGSQVLVMLGTHDPDYLRVVESAVKILTKEENRILVVDYASMNSVAPSAFHTGLLKLSGLKLPDFSEIRRAFLSISIPVIELGNFAPEPQTHVDESVTSKLSLAAISSLNTYLRTDDAGLQIRKAKYYSRRLVKEATLIYEAMLELISHLSSDAHLDIYVANGRFPSQQAIILAGAARGVPVHFYEKGVRKESLFLRDYAPHDRTGWALSAQAFAETKSSREIASLVEKWNSERSSPSSTSNQYSSSWRWGGVEILLSEVKQDVISFFTSSQDEYQSLGIDWQEHEWASQFDAFDQLMSKHESMGRKCVLRVHPNLINKSHEYFIRELDAVHWLQSRHPHLTVISHSNTASSYELLERSKGIVVWDSTIGLEASSRGIPVWACARTIYDEVADIRLVLGPASLREQEFAYWKVNRSGAQKLICFFELGDADLVSAEESLFQPFDVVRSNLALRALRGGTSLSLTETLRFCVDLQRNRGRFFSRAASKSAALLRKITCFSWR